MSPQQDPLPPVATPAVGRVARIEVDDAASRLANRRWWDADAEHYLAEHAHFLGEADFRWCPEGLREADAGLLGDVAGRRVLEVGCGSAPCARWLRSRGAEVVAVDLSGEMLGHAAAAGRRTGLQVGLAQADACHLPIRSASIDVACSSFGAVPFVADPGAVMAEVFRVLRPGGRWVFSVTHPIRWVFPDDPDPERLLVHTSYFDRRPYVEVDTDGVPSYVEHHRTLGDRIRDVVAAGFVLTDLIEPEWTPGNTEVWGQWSPERGALVPGTAIFVCDKADTGSPASAP